MSKKILLVDGSAPFEGPKVNLEGGEWLVGPPSSGKVTLVKANGELIEFNGSGVKITGPSRVWAIIEEGEGINLDAVRMS